MPRTMESKYIRFLQTTIEDVVEEMMFVREIAELFELQHLTATDRHEGYWQPVGHVTGGRSQDRTSEHKHLLAALENRFAQLERRFAELDHQPSCSKDCWEEWFSNPPELQNRITLLRSRLDWLEGVFHDEKQWADYFKRLFRDVRDGQDDWKRDTNEAGSLNTGSRDHS